jgi:hypothetical protein
VAGDEPHELKRRRLDRERVVRTLTFWLRPEFLLRVLNRFQKVAGFDRTGGGAEAVNDIFAPASGTETSLGIIGFLFLMVAVLSFSRAVQRLFEQTWELNPLICRSGPDGRGTGVPRRNRVGAPYVSSV